MKKDLRRIFKVAAPFAGVALGWYLFMPNFTYMEVSGGKYKSQFLIHLMQAETVITGALEYFMSPKEVRDHKNCRIKALSDHVDLSLATPVEEYDKGLT